MSQGNKWQQLYDEALTEKDPMKGLERIAKARDAIRKWLQELAPERGTAEEEKAEQKKTA